MKETANRSFLLCNFWRFFDILRETSNHTFCLNIFPHFESNLKSFHFLDAFENFEGGRKSCNFPTFFDILKELQTMHILKFFFRHFEGNIKSCILPRHFSTFWRNTQIIYFSRRSSTFWRKPQRFHRQINKQRTHGQRRLTNWGYAGNTVNKSRARGQYGCSHWRQTRSTVYDSRKVGRRGLTNKSRAHDLYRSQKK